MPPSAAAASLACAGCSIVLLQPRDSTDAHCGFCGCMALLPPHPPGLKLSETVMRAPRCSCGAALLYLPGPDRVLCSTCIQATSEEGTSLPVDWMDEPLHAACLICGSEPSDFVLDSCAHAACMHCLRTHAASEVSEGRAPRCPLCMAVDAGAGDGLISAPQVDILLEETVWQQLYAKQQMARLGIRECPHCQYSVELGPGVDPLAATCPSPACGRPLHQEDAAAEATFRDWATRSAVQTCPNPACSALVELQEGCNKVTCRCGTTFCYCCQKDLTTQGDANAHFANGNCRLFDAAPGQADD